jgi:hypothetical protein
MKKEESEVIGHYFAAIQIAMRAILDGIVESSDIDRDVLRGFLAERRDQTTDEFAKILLTDLVGDGEAREK